MTLMEMRFVVAKMWFIESLSSKTTRTLALPIHFSPELALDVVPACILLCMNFMKSCENGSSQRVNLRLYSEGRCYGFADF